MGLHLSPTAIWVRIPVIENFKIRHSGLDPESSSSFWIPAFAGMTLLELLVSCIIEVK